MSAALAGGLLVSLTLMGSSRKIFGPEVVQQYLVPHRVDIGVATFFSIGIAVSVQLGLLSTSWGVGGASHIVVAALAQLGYLMSLIGRGDLLSSRLFLLILTWVGIVLGTVTVQVVMEVASLWVVKLRFVELADGLLRMASFEAASGMLVASSSVDIESSAPFIKPKRGSKSPQRSSKSKPKKVAAARKGGRAKR